MTYYEELGIQPDASLEEIRQAYKALARLLHPDAQTDLKLRALAECQMKRLGEVVAILSNPQSRLRYDAELAAGRPYVVKLDWTALVTEPGWMRWVVRNWFWVLLGMVVFTVGVWYFTTRAPAGVVEAQKAVSAAAAWQAPPALPVARRTKPRAHDRRPIVKIDPSPDLPPVQESLPAPPVVVPQIPGGPLVAAIPDAPQPIPQPGAPPSDSRFAANWLYVPPEKPTAVTGQYPATYVELVLQAEKGMLVGHYRSQYKIPDEAISSEVLLQVRGKPATEKSATLQWTSTDGAKGKMELTLSAPNLLNVTWWSTAFGHSTALSSGTSVLVRQMAR